MEGEKKSNHLLQEARDVVLAAGRPGERGAVVHQLSRHDERVSPRQFAIISLTIVVDSEAGGETEQTID